MALSAGAPAEVQSPQEEKLPEGQAARSFAVPGRARELLARARAELEGWQCAKLLRGHLASPRSRELLSRVEAELEGWRHGEFLRGLLVPVDGLLRPLLATHRWPERLDAVAEASNRVSRFAVAFSLASFAVLTASWTALVCLLWVLTTILDVFGGGWLLRPAFEAMAFRQVLRVLALMVPQCTTLFLRFWTYGDQDQVFVAALRQRALAETGMGRARLERLAEALELLPAKSTFQWLREHTLALVKGWCVALGLLLVSSCSGLAWLLLPAAWALRRLKALGLVPALALLAVFLLPRALLPNGRMMAACGLQLLLTARTVSYELLYTMTGRCSRAQRRALACRHHARLTGFGVAMAALLGIPLVGPLLWFDLVKLAAEVLGTVVLEEGEEFFDLRPALEDFRALQARRQQRQEQRARELEVRVQKRMSERSLRAGGGEAAGAVGREGEEAGLRSRAAGSCSEQGAASGQVD